MDKKIKYFKDLPKEDLGHGFYLQGNWLIQKTEYQDADVFNPSQLAAIELLIKRYIEKGSFLDWSV